MKTGFLAHFLVSVLVLLQAASSASVADEAKPEGGYAWGEERRGLKVGVRVEKAEGGHPDLVTFTTAVKNCTDKTIKVAAGDTWDGPIRPDYEIGDGVDKRWKVAPPSILQSGIGITHVARPIYLELEPDEIRIVHRSLFVPPVPAGLWKVQARLLPNTGRRDDVRLRETRHENIWVGGTLISGEAELALEKGERQSPE